MSKKHKHKHKHKHESAAQDIVYAQGSVEKCWHSHPILKLGGGTFHGASCIYPHTGYDIYVGLDWGMKQHQQFPWQPPPEKKIIDVYFPITDGKVPTDRKEFDAMIQWLIEQLAEGKRIHAGCIGGHGRTGLLLAALVSRLHGDPKAGDWVRANYCSMAVETHEQVKFLQTYYGIEEFKPSRHYEPAISWMLPAADKQEPVSTNYSPMAGRSIWGKIVQSILPT